MFYKSLIVLLASCLSLLGGTISIGERLFIGEWIPGGGTTSSVTYSNVNSIQLFTYGTNGTTMSDSVLAASAYGSTAWTSFYEAFDETNRSGSQSFKFATNITFTFPQPITAGGHIVSNTADGGTVTKWLTAALTNRPNLQEWVRFTHAVPAALAEYTFYVGITGRGAVSDVNIDIAGEYSASPWSIFELRFHQWIAAGPMLYEPSIHFQSDSGSSVNTIMNAYSESWYRVEGVTDRRNAFVYWKIFNATNNAFLAGWIGNDFSHSTNNAASFDFMDNYILGTPFTNGSQWITAGTVNTSYVYTNRAPWVPQTPTNLVAVQDGNFSLGVSWGDAGQMMNQFYLDLLTNGVWWTNAATVSPRTTSYSFTGLIATNYQVRVRSALTNTGVFSSYVTSSSVTITSVPSSTFYTSISSTHLDAPLGNVTKLGGQIFIGASDLVVTDLGMYAYDSGTYTVKIWDSGCSQVATASVDCSGSKDANNFAFSSITPVTLTAGGTYYVTFDNTGDTGSRKNATMNHSGDASVGVDVWGSACSDTIFGTTGRINLGANFKYHL